MVTNNISIVCPACGAVNDYDIIRNEMVDAELHTTYCCEACQCQFTNIYGLVYLGGYSDEVAYDRDNLTVKR